MSDAPKSNAPGDTERLDWLALRYVQVRQPLLHGSRHLFDCCPEEQEGLPDSKSNIRELIDSELKGK